MLPLTDFDLFNLGLGAVNPFLALGVLFLFAGLPFYPNRIGGLVNALDRASALWPSVVEVAAIFLLTWL
jgi:hypothetical protein